MFYKTSLTLLSTLLCSAVASATTLVFDTDADSDQPQAIYLADGKLRMGAPGDDWMLFDRVSNTMFMVNDQEQEYYVMDEAQMQALGQTLGNVNKQIEEALSQVPESQRAQMRAMMESMMPGGGGAGQAEELVDVNFTGQQDRVAGISCEIVETRINGQPESQLCIADPDALNLSSDELATVRAMGDFAEQMLNTMKEHAGNLIPDGFSAGSVVKVLDNGVPIRVVDKDSNDVSQLESVNADDVDANLLRVPAEYQRKSFGPGN